MQNPDDRMIWWHWVFSSFGVWFSSKNFANRYQIWHMSVLIRQFWEYAKSLLCNRKSGSRPLQTEEGPMLVPSLPLWMSTKWSSTNFANCRRSSHKSLKDLRHLYICEYNRWLSYRPLLSKEVSRSVPSLWLVVFSKCKLI